MAAFCRKFLPAILNDQMTQLARKTKAAARALAQWATAQKNDHPRSAKHMRAREKHIRIYSP
jgi:hypothetical protein